MQEEGLSLLAQSNRLHEYAERKDLDVIKTFEIVESSTHGERKQFMEMINFCKKQRETIAIVADTVDRVQRSFKESVLLDELMRQDKIELHFYREGMVLNSKSSSVDIMRWDFSVMGAKAYVLQLSENIRRSNEQKNKNGEITGQAPLGYENYIDHRGKNFIRPKSGDAAIVRQLFEMYSLGCSSVTEIAHYARKMGLCRRRGAPVSNNAIYYMLDNPFYYGEMRTIRGLVPHVYEPIISKELWDKCQEQKAKRSGKPFEYSSMPFVFRNLITCGITNRQCPNDLKKKKYSYVVCYTKDNGRMYISEDHISKQISAILNRIKLPDNIIIELQHELKQSKVAERKYCTQEISKLKTEQNKLKEKLDHLFDMRLDGELEKESFDFKRNEIQLKIERINKKISSHEKANTSFDDIILSLLDIATRAGDVFEKSSNLELKRLVLKFVFEKIILTEGKLTYKLKFPFNEFENATILNQTGMKAYELENLKQNSALQANDNKNIEKITNLSYEPQIFDKKQGGFIIRKRGKEKLPKDYKVL